MLTLTQEASERWKEGDRDRYWPLTALLASVCTGVGSTAASSMLVSETVSVNEKGRCTGRGGRECTGRMVYNAVAAALKSALLQ